MTIPAAPKHLTQAVHRLAPITPMECGVLAYALAAEMSRAGASDLHIIREEAVLAAAVSDMLHDLGVPKGKILKHLRLAQRAVVVAADIVREMQRQRRSAS